MARGNTRQKPSEQLQGRGSRFKGQPTLTLTLVRPDDRRAVPEFPEYLDPAYRPVWDAYWEDPVSKLVTRADEYDLGRYFMLLAHRDKLQGEALADPITKGSMDQDVPNPRFRIVAQLNREIEKYREQLGVLALARMKLGLATGLAQEATARGIRAQLDAAGGPPQRRVFGKAGA
jgi:hypothetical protein